MTFMKEEKLGEMLGIGVGSRVSITVQDAFIIFSDSGALKESQFQVQNSKVFSFREARILVSEYSAFIWLRKHTILTLKSFR